MTRRTAVVTTALVIALAACGGPKAQDPALGYGPDPKLPEPSSR